MTYFDSQVRHRELLKSEREIHSKYSRISVVFKATSPFIYHYLAGVLMLEAESEGYAAFSINAIQLKKFLTQKPKPNLRMGSISGALL